MLDPYFAPLPATPHVKLAAPRAIFSISAFAGGAAALCTALGAKLPSTPKRIEANGISYLWSGADSWLAMAPNPEILAAPLAAAEPHAAITDQSDGKAIFILTGPNIRTRLAALIPIDLHETVFAPDSAALTLAGHIPVQIWMNKDENFELACFRSYAASLYHALVEAL